MFNEAIIASEYKHELKIPFDVIEHGYRVSKIAYDIADILRLSNSQKTEVSVAGMIHDYGKAWIENSILYKKGKLTDEEFCEIKKHAFYSSQIVKTSNTLGKYSNIILYHHEKVDGSGYFGLEGDQIPLESKIIVIADIFDALSSNREYRQAYRIDETLNIMYSEKNKYDKNVFNAFEQWVENQYRNICIVEEEKRLFI